jgi:hypothetical protein
LHSVVLFDLDLIYLNITHLRSETG